MNPRVQSLMRGAMLLLLGSATVAQRFGFGIGEFSITPAFIAIYVVLALAAWCGVLVISASRLSLYFGFIVIGVLSVAFNESRASVPSLLLLAAMYLPFVFGLKPNALGEDSAGFMIDRFLGLSFVCATIGIAQFFAQFAIHGEWLFNFTVLIPESLRNTGDFNTVIPVGGFYKSNGFLFLEPSGFSLFMGLGLITESVLYKRPLRLACYALALLVTYSGTGILALLIGASYPLGKKTFLRLGAVACAGALIYAVFDDALNLSITLSRAAEFNASDPNNNSSGYIRYIAPGRLVSELFTSDPWSAWVGHGPGTIFKTVRDYYFHDPTWAKLLFEYGGLGFAFALALYVMTLRHREIPIQLRAMLFWAWLIMGGHLLSPEQNFMTLVLVGLLPLGERAESSTGDEELSLEREGSGVTLPLDRTDAFGAAAGATPWSRLGGSHG